MLRSRRRRCRACSETATGSTTDAPTLLYAIEILDAAAPPARSPILRRSRQHGRRVLSIESDLSLRALLDRHMRIESAADNPCFTATTCSRVRCVRTPQETSKPTPPRRTDAARLGVDGGYSADRKTVASLGVRHGVGRPHYARKRRDIRDLIEDLLVNFGDPAIVRVDDRRNAHCAERRNFLANVRDFLETANVHCGFLSRELVWS